MKISIITPTRNYGKFLQTCLQSVYDQWKDGDSGFAIEHIVVDACSTDETIELLKRWEAEHAGNARYSLLWTSEPDKGQTDAINKGLRKSSGDLVCWLNADEIYYPGALDTVARYFGNHEKIDIAYGEINFLNETGAVIRRKYDHPFSGFVLLWCGCYIASAATFWRRSILQDGLFLDDSFKVTMDFDYWVRIWKAGYRFGFMPALISGFAWHDSNVSSVFAERRVKERHTVQLAHCPKWFRSDRAQLHFISFVAFLAHQWRRILVILRRLTYPT